MKFVIRGRAGGKTHAAVEWLREDPDHRVILCANLAMAGEIRRRHGLSDKQVMTPDAARTRGRRAEFAVEDLDTLLPYLLGTGPNPVALVTATGESA